MSAAALWRRLVNAARYLAHGAPMAAEPRPASRVGLLNTGELIVLLSGGSQLVLSAETTDLVRDMLEADARAFDAMPLPTGLAGPTLYDLATGESRPVKAAKAAKMSTVTEGAQA